MAPREANYAQSSNKIFLIPEATPEGTIEYVRKKNVKSVFEAFSNMEPQESLPLLFREALMNMSQDTTKSLSDALLDEVENRKELITFAELLNLNPISVELKKGDAVKVLQQVAILLILNALDGTLLGPIPIVTSKSAKVWLL